jgi:hypothetical protein
MKPAALGERRASVFVAAHSDGAENSPSQVLRKPIRAELVPDAKYPGMWRVRWPDGSLSDIVNLTRAKDALASFLETEERRQRGRHGRAGRPPMRQNRRGAS